MTVKKASIFISLLGILGAAIIGLKPKSNYQTETIEIGNQKLLVEIADDPQKRTLGLGGRDSLAKNRGMLFLFSQSGYPAIWMKEMRFPIDIIWLQDDKIVDIAHNVPPPSPGQIQLTTYTPKNKANQVLEVNANWTSQNNIKIGDTIYFKP